MKKLSMQWVVFGAVLSVSAIAGARADSSGVPAPANGGPFPAPDLVMNPSDEIFAPPGFDDNDEVQIVLHGELINTCYKVAPPLVTVDRVQHMITVASQAYVYPSSWCLQVLTPVTQTVGLGLLSAGQYRVVEYNGAGRVVHDVSLRVEVSISANPDDFLYAPVTHAKINLGAPGSPKTLVLSGNFTSDCMEMQEVKVLHRVPNVIEILPVAAYKTGTTCKPAFTPFEVSVALPAVEPGNTLVYVRSLNGQALSEVLPF